ncbi:MAG: GNAT family protein [archaeon]
MKRVVGHVHVFNKASARMLEKSGYRLEGRLRKDHFQNGKYFDNLLYAVVK